MVFEDYSTVGFQGQGCIKVRYNENDYTFYLFPLTAIEDVIRVMEEAQVYHKVIPCVNADVLSKLPVEESQISIEGYDESECVALHSSIDINELYEMMDFISKNPGMKLDIQAFKNTELPEYQDVLNEKARRELTVEQQAVFSGYMRALLDMNKSDLAGMILEFSERSGFDHLLRYYTDTVRGYIYDNISKRMAAMISENPSDDQ